MHATQKNLVSREEYLKLERLADLRSEYHKGQIFAMAGASRNHNRIVTNLSTSLDIQLKSRDCNNYSSDMRISVQSGERYLYPDIVVTCGKETFEDDSNDTLKNPKVIVEVLSSSTEAYDRGLKFLYYQTIDSLQEYVLISQHPHRIEVYYKQADGTWAYRAFNKMPEKIKLQSINCILDTDDIYFKVEGEVEKSYP
jgi:Uma2 family endonuclease